MYKKLLFIFVCFFMFNLSAKSFGGEQFVAPSGTEKKAILAQIVSLKTAVVGQKVEAILLDDFIYDDNVIAPKNSVVIGSIVSYFNSEKTTDESTLHVKFTTIRTPYNNIIPISAVIKTDNENGVLKPDKETNEILLKPNKEINILFTQPITLSAQ